MKIPIAFVLGAAYEVVVAAMLTALPTISASAPAHPSPEMLLPSAVAMALTATVVAYCSSVRDLVATAAAAFGGCVAAAGVEAAYFTAVRHESVGQSPLGAIFAILV